MRQQQLRTHSPPLERPGSPEAGQVYRVGSAECTEQETEPENPPSCVMTGNNVVVSLLGRGAGRAFSVGTVCNWSRGGERLIEPLSGRNVVGVPR